MPVATMTRHLRHAQALLCPGAPFPAQEGGQVFRLLAERHGIPESKWSELAHQLGLWPYRTGEQVGKARTAAAAL